MKLFRFYRKAVIYPSIFLLFFSTIYSIIDNNKSEWSTAKSAIVMSVITSSIYFLLMCVLSLTIFLNKFQKLNKNLFWNILTWFLLPFGYITIVLIFDIKNRIKYEFGFGNSFIYLLIMTLPFVIGLCWTFMKYRQKIHL
ncbi:MAG: hypothetical protein JSV22_04025 [Bacteroidales bacterium]|nr:MAG: hypothetical protein JSV22_04025 [Bacteroidales bacterium]